MQSPSPSAQALVARVILPYLAPTTLRDWAIDDPKVSTILALDLSKYFWVVVNCFMMVGVVVSLKGQDEEEQKETDKKEWLDKLKVRAIRGTKTCGWVLLHSLAFSLSFVNVFYPFGLHIFEQFYGLTRSDSQLEMYLLWRTFISQLLASTLTLAVMKFSNNWPLSTYFSVWLCTSLHAFVVFQRD